MKAVMSTKSISFTGMLWCIAISLGFCTYVAIHVASTTRGPTAGSFEAANVSPGAANSYEVTMRSHEEIAEHLEVRDMVLQLLCHVIPDLIMIINFSF